MLRHCGRRVRQRLQSSDILGKSYWSLSAPSGAVSTAFESRHFAAEAVREEDSERAEAAQRAVHERLVFELLGIRERIAGNVTRKALSTYQDTGARLHSSDEVNMHKAPLSYLLALTEGRSSEEEQEVLKAWRRQAHNETRALDEAVEKWREEVAGLRERGAIGRMPLAKRMMLQWFEPLRDAIAREQHAVVMSGLDRDRAQLKSGMLVYGPLLLLLPAEELAVITLHIAIKDLMSGKLWMTHNFRKQKEVAGSANLTAIAKSIGQSAQTQVRIAEEAADAKEVQGLSKILVMLLKRNPHITPFHIQTLVHKREVEGLRGDPALKAHMASVLAAARERDDLSEGAQRLLQDIAGKDVMDQFETIMRKHKLNPVSSNPMKLFQARKRAKRALKTAVGALQGDWDESQIIHLGVALLHHLLETATVSVPVLDGCGMPIPGQMQEERAFWTNVTPRGRGPAKSALVYIGKLHMHEEVLRLLDGLRAADDMQMHMLKVQPMVVPPLPWRSLESGGLLFTRFPVMRTRTAAQVQALQEAEAAAPDGLRRVYAALNAIGEVAWCINRPVLDALKHAGDRGMQIGSMPPLGDLPLRDTPKGSAFVVQRAPKWLNGQLHVTSGSPETRWERWQRKQHNQWVRKTNAENYSQRCDFQNKMRVAEQFRDEPGMWFPHNMDFRGRAYPMPPHLNHLGSDTSRGILQFAEGRALGEHGLEWLYVQITNSWGQSVDKGSYAERKVFVRDHLDLVLDSAERPFDGHKWWQSAEKPWEALAACMEVRDALATGDPATFVSRLPVQIDGSCNGLQHYAALGRDLDGGFSVNLLPSDRPQDVYTGVAKEVQSIAEQDAKDGMLEAQALLGNIDRKLVKQTVMTSVYGVTWVGARDQVQNRLKDKGWAVSDDLTFKVSMYAATATLRGLSAKFSRATETMRWLRQCASTVSRETKQTVSWTTPLGLRCVQPYLKNDDQSIWTVLQKVRIQKGTSTTPDAAKQGSAFPPNYIHSLDSTHMMMTALACKDAGIAFAGVHDSFWTHAADVPILARLLREAFVDLHSQPLLQNLHDELTARQPGSTEPQARHDDKIDSQPNSEDLHKKRPGKKKLDPQIPDPPELGDLDLNQVREAEYFFN